MLNVLRARHANYKWWAFATVAMGTFVSVLDQSGLSLALPLIAADLDASIPAVQWVTLAYMLATSSLLLPVGRMSDILGRKRVYVAGFVIFIAAAILAGSSNTLDFIIGFKALQGVGAAMIQANGMAIVTTTFPARERGKAIGTLMTTVGSGAIAGPIISGAVVGVFGWRAAFFLGVPIGLLSLAAAIAVLDSGAHSSRDGGGKAGFDWLGAGLSAAALSILLLVVTNAHALGWASPLAISALGAVVVMLGAFVWWESRAPQPMLSLELFRRRLFTLGSAASFLTFMAGSSVFFLMPFFLQGVRGLTPWETGLLLSPTAVCFAVAGPIAGRLSDRYGWRWFIIGSLVVNGIAMLGLATVGDDAPVWRLMGALFLQSIGMGFFYSPNSSAVLSTVERSRYGVATAFMTLMRTGATVIGIALVTSVVTAVMGSMGYEPSLNAIASQGVNEGVRGAFTQGLRTAFYVMFGLNLVALVLSSVPGTSAPSAVNHADVGERAPAR